MDAIKRIVVQPADSSDPFHALFTGAPGAHGADIKCGCPDGFEQGQVVKSRIMSQGDNSRRCVASALGNIAGGHHLH
ncbi:hypothetical protein D3C85_1833190 [compost metagenome]